MTVLKSEAEIVIYAKVGNFEGLKQADSVIGQEQLELRVDGKGTVRVRKSLNEDGEVYEATVKSIKRKIGNDTVDVALKAVEENIEASPSFFEAFKFVASKLFVKKRYLFNGKSTTVVKDGVEYALPPILYEVDVYERHDGKIIEWCKIDIEVDELLKTINSIPELKGVDIGLDINVKDLPFIPQEAFIVGSENSDAQKRLVKKLWEEEYPHNPKGGALRPMQPSIAATMETPPADGSDDSLNANQPSEDKPTEGNDDGKENTEGST